MLCIDRSAACCDDFAIIRRVGNAQSPRLLDDICIAVRIATLSYDSTLDEVGSGSYTAILFGRHRVRLVWVCRELVGLPISPQRDGAWVHINLDIRIYNACHRILPAPQCGRLFSRFVLHVPGMR